MMYPTLFTSNQADRYSLPPAPVHSRVVELSENSLYCPSSSTARESSFTTDSEAACEMEKPTFDALYMTDDNEPLALRWIAIFKANTSTQSDIVNMGKVANILASEKFEPEHLNHDTGASLIDEFISPLLKAAIPSMGVYAKYILALRSVLNGGGKCADASKSKRNLSTEDTKTAGTKRTGGSTKRTGDTSLTKEEASGDDDGDVDVDSPLGDHNTKPAKAWALQAMKDVLQSNPMHYAMEGEEKRILERLHQAGETQSGSESRLALLRQGEAAYYAMYKTVHKFEVGLDVTPEELKGLTWPCIQQAKQVVDYVASIIRESGGSSKGNPPTGSKSRAPVFFSSVAAAACNMLSSACIDPGSVILQKKVSACDSHAVGHLAQSSDKDCLKGPQSSQAATLVPTLQRPLQWLNTLPLPEVLEAGVKVYLGASGIQNKMFFSAVAIGELIDMVTVEQLSQDTEVWLKILCRTGLSSTASLHDEDQTLSWIDDSVIKPSESPATMKDVADAITNGTATTWPLIGLQVLNGFTGETAGQAWLKFEAANNKAATRKQAADMAEHSLPPINGRGRGGRRNSADAAKMMSSSSGQK
ncbi:hypothetical protein CEUSTIGMA_g13425.t1 [Chlamydomonas eustigma]|uniref:Uncharacterized protein n=1 Tax=Chlamydomonas eustigma TaxID=1157962 RepID=A0A250XSS5_9CHLO|nr:hypothetical protein CEUSTIGMA_g13425.t1 [Chlamydomonas eustigma]|eukprot:GAX86009.1 hypothetical protein CEUSTIGMA_g13425.t1 [Chlamydomonas eustigma]